jgi:threonine/homoserine/homoserine lactone efflux protein
MDGAWIAAVCGFALAMASTPGPNNTILTASGANYGFRRTIPHLIGVALGVAAIFLAVGALGSALLSDPRVRGPLKWAGLAYLLWLAWRIASAEPTLTTSNGRRRDDARGRPFTLPQGALFQLVNPKLWTMVAGAVATYGSTAGAESALAIAAAFGVIFGVATFAGTALWTLLGVWVGRIIRTERALRVFNWSMAALLVASLIPVMAE